MDQDAKGSTPAEQGKKPITQGLRDRFGDELQKQFVSTIVRVLFGALAVAGLGLYAIFKTLARLQVQVSWAILTTICLVVFALGCLGVVGASAYLRSQRDVTFAERLRRWRIAFKRTVMVYVPVAIGIAFCVWAYLIGSKVFQMSDDVRHLRIQAVRYVLPRELTEHQITTFADTIKNVKPSALVFKLVKGDQEANQFSGFLQTAFNRASWPDARVDPVDDVLEGLGVDVQYEGPVEQQQRAEPISQALLRAFQAADIPSFGGVSSRGGIERPEPLLTVTISIGHRRRDKFALQPKRRFKKGEPWPPGWPNDDDFDFFK